MTGDLSNMFVAIIPKVDSGFTSSQLATGNDYSGQVRLKGSVPFWAKLSLFTTKSALNIF